MPQAAMTPAVMLRKHPIIFGAVLGLITGIVVFVGGMALPPESFVAKGVELLQLPLVPVVHWMRGASPNWGRSTDLFKVMGLVLGYWTLLGLLAGAGCRWLLGRKGG